MQRIAFVEDKGQPVIAEIFRQIKGALGVVPGLFRISANSPTVLTALWAGFGAAASGKLSATLVEKISAAVSNSNRCEYCLAAHTALGLKAGASAAEMAAAKIGQGKDTKETAAITFALRLLKDAGHVSDSEFADATKFYSEEEIVEIIHVTSLTTFTNTVNTALKTPVDFPAVPLQAV